MVLVRSLGWNFGMFREIVGGGLDTATQAAGLIKGKSPEMTYRMSYTIALPIVVGTMGAMLQYLLTGKGPQELKDYFFPKTGNLDENGRPERISLPSYMKDIWHYAQDPARTLKNKVNPAISAMAQMLENRDFYGTRIRNEDDPILKQILQVGKYGLQQFEPFGFRGYAKERQLGETPTKAALSFVGITPAPRDVNKTPAERIMSQLVSEKIPAGTRTQQQYQEQDLKSAIRRDLRMGKQDKLREAISQGKLSGREIVELKRESRFTPLEEGFKRLPLDEAVKVYEAANPKERAGLRGLLLQKTARTNYYAAPAEKRQLAPIISRAKALAVQ